MERLTKKYSNGIITLDSSLFGVDQNCLDSEINCSEPIKQAIAKLFEYENAGIDPKTMERIKSQYFGTSM